MLIAITLLILGFASLIFGANWLVEGASALAKKHKISDLVIGLTIVAFGTSAPELVVNSIASFDGCSEIVLGNIIGSNNFNLFMILATAGLIYPISVHSSMVYWEIPISLLCGILLFIMGNWFLGDQTEISRVEGSILFLCFAGFLYYVFKQMKKEEKSATFYQKKSKLKIWGLIMLGLTGLILGGQLVVNNGIQIATTLGVSEKIIGLTIIAAGTSLPELVTSVIAAVKKNSDIAIGNVVGSNIFNILLILAISSFINPISFNPNFNIDILMLLAGSLFLFICMFIGKKHQLERWQSALLLSFYLAYTVYLVWKEL